jgi:hypothetical protein
MTENYIDQLRARAQEKRSRTYHGYASSDLDDNRGGRYAVTRKTVLTGTDPIARYASQPPNSPWHADPVGPEPFIDGTGDGARLGYGIDAADGMPPSSEVAEPPAPATDDVRRPTIRLRRRI